MMGAVADRTRSRHGRYRPWMLWIAIPYGLLAIAAFVTPDVDIGRKLVYAYISYALLMTAYTAINVPYSALGGVMTGGQRGARQPADLALRDGHGGRLPGHQFDLSACQDTGRRRSAKELPTGLSAGDDGDGHHRVWCASSPAFA